MEENLKFPVEPAKDDTTVTLSKIEIMYMNNN
jgi:hypothetical protein